MPLLSPAPFGRVLTAMVTPFAPDGRLDIPGAQRLATHLLAHGNDGLVLSGTTGEAPTTSDAEQDTLLRAVREAVGDTVPLLAGVGSFDTAHSIDLALAAEKAGADGLLLVSPYYSRPPQAGLLAHVTDVVDATGLPVMLYDIPARTGVAFSTETLLRLAEHPRVVAIKDAKDDLCAASRVIAESDLAVYSGTDALNLPLLAIGAVGFVAATGHVLGRELAAMVACFDAGDAAGALALHQQILPATVGFFRTQAAILLKAALGLMGLPGGPVRRPLVDATPEEIAQLVADLARAGIALTPDATNVAERGAEATDATQVAEPAAVTTDATQVAPPVERAGVPA